MRGKQAQRGSETSSLPPSGPSGEPVQFFRVLTQHFLPCCQAKAEADFSVFGVTRAHPSQKPLLCFLPSSELWGTSRTEAASSSQDLVVTTALFRSRSSSGMGSEPLP